MKADEAELDSTSQKVPLSVHPFTGAPAADVSGSTDTLAPAADTTSKKQDGVTAADAATTAEPLYPSAGPVGADVIARQPSPRTVSLPPLQHMLHTKAGPQHSPLPALQRPLSSFAEVSRRLSRQPSPDASPGRADPCDGAGAASGIHLQTASHKAPVEPAAGALANPVEGGRPSSRTALTGDHTDLSIALNAAASRLSGANAPREPRRQTAFFSGAMSDSGIGTHHTSVPELGRQAFTTREAVTSGNGQGAFALPNGLNHLRPPSMREDANCSSSAGNGPAPNFRALETQLQQLQVHRNQTAMWSCSSLSSCTACEHHLRRKPCVNVACIALSCLPQAAVLIAHLVSLDVTSPV